MISVIWNDLCYTWKKILINSIGIAIMMFLGIVLFTTYQEQSRQYEPFRTTLKSEGVVVEASEGINDIYAEGLENWLSQFNKVKNCYYNYSDSVYINGVEQYSYKVYGYGGMFGEYIPMLKDGVWYTEYEGDKIPVVVSDSYNIEVGDEIDIFFYNRKEFTPVYVCGVLEDGATYYKEGYFSSDVDIFNFYDVFDATREDQYALMFMDMDNMLKLDFGARCSRLFIEYDESITEDEIKENEDIFDKKEMVMRISFEEIRKNSVEIIEQKLMVIIPVVVGAFLLIFLAIATTVAIDTSQSMCRYAVFYCCGMNWWKNGLINVAKAIVSCAIGYLLMLTGYNFIMASGYGDLLLFSLGKGQILICLAITGCMIAIAAAVPLCILFRNQPVKVLKDNYI